MSKCDDGRHDASDLTEQKNHVPAEIGGLPALLEQMFTKNLLSVAAAEPDATDGCKRCSAALAAISHC